MYVIIYVHYRIKYNKKTERKNGGGVDSIINYVKSQRIKREERTQE